MKRVSAAAAGLLASIFWWSTAGAIDSNLGPQSRGWDGYYIGVSAGYLRATARWSDGFGFTAGDFSGDGTAIGLTAGKNWQNGRWVYGIEGDISLAEQRAVSNAFPCFPIDCRSDLTSLATLRGRVGYLFTPNLLVFGTAGAAAAGLDHGNFLFSSARNTAFGFAAGAGIEKRIAPRWTVKAEYLYVSIGSNEACGAAICVISVENDKFETHVFRLGLNYHFGQSGVQPLPAAPANRWTGFYAGVFFGHAQAETEWTFPGGVTSGPFDGEGALGGVNAGFNWQSGRWIYGIEADAALADIHVSFFGFLETKISQLFTFRGRLGYLVTPGVLVYATGGIAAAPMKFRFAGVETASSVEIAPVIGGGLEVQLARNWTAKGEYLYIAFGNAEACGALCFPVTLTSDHIDAHLFRFGVNRYF